jgi:hypothetical protein
VTRVSVRYPWIDLNSDKFVQANEIQLGSQRRQDAAGGDGNWDPNNPANAGTANTVDPNYKNDRTDEFIVGIDREIGAGFAAGINYIWRRYSNFTFYDTIGLEPSNFVRCRSRRPRARAPRPRTPVPDRDVLPADVPAADDHERDELHGGSVQPRLQRRRGHRPQADVTALADEHSFVFNSTIVNNGYAGAFANTVQEDPTNLRPATASSTTTRRPAAASGTCT